MKRLLLCIAAICLFGTEGWAKVQDSRASEAQICSTKTARAEQAFGIPHAFLYAISLTETGRWDKTHQAKFAWPWTVMAKNKGRYFDSKAQAIAAVKRLQAEGVRNIDVGCMQVNLQYHGEAFASLSDAMDPVKNVTYAATFLDRLYDQLGTWESAAAAYHSRTPKRGAYYLDKVMGFWDRDGHEAEDVVEAASLQEPADTPPKTAPTVRAVPRAAKALAKGPKIDHLRMARLNDRFRANRTTARKVSPGGVRSGQVKAWLNGINGRGLTGSHMATMRRADLAAEQQRRVRGGTKSTTASFAMKRRSQLAKWRQSAVFSRKMPASTTTQLPPKYKSE